MRWSAGKENYLVIDHSGNLEGYAPEIAYVYENGFHSLDMSERKVRIREGKDRERKESKCPRCGNVLIRRSPNCDTCGYAFSQRESKAITVAAVFRQIDLRNPDHIESMEAEDKVDLWGQLCAAGYGTASIRYGTRQEVCVCAVGFDHGLEQPSSEPLLQGEAPRDATGAKHCSGELQPVESEAGGMTGETCTSPLTIVSSFLTMRLLETILCHLNCWFQSKDAQVVMITTPIPTL